MKMSKTKYILSLLGAFMLGVVLIGGASAYKLAALEAGGTDLIDGSKLEKIDKIIQMYYLNDYDKKDLAEGAYEGYVKALGDPYSAYMNKEDYEAWNASATGEYSGVGITFSEDENHNYVVLSVNKNSPAEKAGFKAGDFIVSVDGEEYDDIDVMASAIRGDEGTDVTVVYYRDGKKHKVTMTRKKIIQESVDYKMLDSDTGYIKIDQFIESTGPDFDAALKKIEGKGASKLVLDLRDNGGGLVDESVSVADQFLNEGVVCYVEDKNGNTDTYDAKDGKTKLETVVLVNENSASASEILSASMKDNGYKLVGKKTFGKGIIQTSLDLGDGTGLKVTIMQYLSPEKKVIHKKGIEPDYEIADDEDTEADEQLEKAQEVLNSK